jgi:hypothetical protein
MYIRGATIWFAAAFSRSATIAFGSSRPIGAGLLRRRATLRRQRPGTAGQQGEGDRGPRRTSRAQGHG